MKLTPEIQKKIVGALAVGNFRKHAAGVAGVDERTFKNWMRWGQLENAKEPFRSFAFAVLEAEHTAIARNVRVVNRAANEGDWKAAAWYLSRKAKEEWGDQVRKSVKEQFEFLLQVIVDVLGPDSAAVVFEEVTRRAGREEGEGAESPPAGTATH